jgi:MoxR-like ATPase
MARLTCLDPSRKIPPTEIPSEGLLIGRGRRCNLILDDGKVSAEHTLLRCDDGTWWMFDLQSSNGVLVNDQLMPAARLKDGDRIKIGDTVFQFQANGGGKPAASAQSAATPPTPEQQDDLQAVADLKRAYGLMQERLGQVIVGQRQVIEEVLIAVLCRGHALLVGVPGVAKTLLVSTLSHILDMSFKRIQFTPDLMPSDITGSDVLEEDHTTGKRIFRFVHGPVFANMILADEINRTPPKTQAALLEAMQEHRVTVGDQTYRLPEPFFVLATQNPIEQEGTYPLPEAQLDRFMFNIIVDYPDADEERRIIRQVTGAEQPAVEVALTAEDVLRLQQVVRRVPAADHVIEYARDLARATRPKDPTAPDFVREMVQWGGGPRAGICLITAAKARAILKGRYHATTADVRAMALPVLRHRLVLTFNAEAAGINSDELIRKLVEQVVPSQAPEM